jgi:creatinine amidohydrolase/Fe(II)-dependent formamide hydrolase-like protein
MGRVSWKDVYKLTKTMKMTAIPTAACEQHGPRLPLAVDTIDYHEVAKRVSANYETFFEYRIDQYSESGVVGRGATEATAELGEKLLGMVVEELVSMIQKDLNEEKPKQHHNNNGKSGNATKKRK